MNNTKLFSTLIFLFSIKAVAINLPSSTSLEGDQVIPNLDGKERSKYLPGNRVIPHLEIKDKELGETVEKARLKVEEVLNVTPEKTIPVPVPEKEEEQEVVQEEERPKKKVKKTSQKKPKRRPKKKRIKKKGMKVFYANLRFLKSPKILSQAKTVSIPSGATTMATLQYGLEVPSPEDEVSARIDAYFLGPNKTYVMMKSCITWIKLTHHFSTRRVFGTTQKISCRSPNGRTFEIPFRATIVNHKNEYAGMVGQLRLNGKLQASLFQFGKDVTSAFGDAMAASNLSKNVVSGGENQRPFESENVTGSRRHFIAGKMAESAGSFLDWHTKFYIGMTPTLAVPPGTKIYLVLKDTVSVPKMFFTSEEYTGSKTKNNHNTSGTYPMLDKKEVKLEN